MKLKVLFKTQEKQIAIMPTVGIVWNGVLDGCKIECGVVFWWILWEVAVAFVK